MKTYTSALSNKQRAQKKKKVHFKWPVTAIVPCPYGVRRSLPVSRQCRESEHRHADWSELDEGDNFAAHSPEEPLLCQVTAGIHRSAGHQQ